MSCNCIPKQKEPHIVRSSTVKTWYLSIPVRLKKYLRKWEVVKRFIILSVYTNLTYPLTCDGKEVPVSKYQIKLF